MGDWYTEVGDIQANFYELLGVEPTASGRDIKRAYYALMRSYHPDQAGSSDEAFTELTALLHEVYDTLRDPARRAAYDELVGFSSTSTNPFTHPDPATPQDQVFVDEFACIGCGKCATTCPRTFMMEEAWGRARAMAQDADTAPKLQEAIDVCPVSCIHWVTTPQLSLLEASMARMERVPVNSLGLGHGSAKNVFLEASLAWEKRHQAIQRRLAEASGPRVVQNTGFWSMFGAMNNAVAWEGAFGARVYDRQQSEQQRRQQQQQQAQGAAGSGSWSDSEGGSWSGSSEEDEARSSEPLTDKDTRTIATLAAKAARAARTWKSFQELERAKRRAPLQLAEVTVSSRR